MTTIPNIRKATSAETKTSVRPRRKNRKDGRPHKILKALALGSGVIVVSLVAPAGGAVIVRNLISCYFKQKKFERRKFLTDLKNLQARELINFQEHNNGTVEIAISNQGKKHTLAYRIDEMKLRRPNQWDKKWRLVMFDVPHSFKQARDALRQKLQDLKFYQLQKSVYITPYPCEDEIDFIASIFDVRKHIIILHVDKFEGEEKLRYHFKL